MNNSSRIDLKKEQEAALARPRCKYSLAARFFFFSMDLVTGSRTTLGKAKLIETLACVPYRAWENRQYSLMTRRYRAADFIDKARRIVDWSRSAQDNEYWHLLVINEKMKQDGVKDPWYLMPLVPFMMVLSYQILAGTMALFSIRSAFLFNAEFEDHAEHVYAGFVREHPELETQAVNSDLIAQYGSFKNWADVFRRIGLDERDHMNTSFIYAGKPECVVKYDGMPGINHEDKNK